MSFRQHPMASAVQFPPAPTWRKIIKSFIAFVSLIASSATNSVVAFDPNSICDTHDTMVSNLSVHQEVRQLTFVDENGWTYGLFYHPDEGTQSYTLLRTKEATKDITCIASAGEIQSGLFNKTGDERFFAMLDENNGSLWEIFLDRTRTNYSLYLSSRHTDFTPTLVGVGLVIWTAPDAIPQSTGEALPFGSGLL